jgi:hypothetical protein
MTHVGLFGVGIAAAHVAKTTREVSKEGDLSCVISGVSVRRQILGQNVYNDLGQVVGRIDDVIITDRKATYGIVGVGGFLGLGAHDVAIEVDKFVREHDRLLLPGASREAIRAMSRFEYGQISS